KSIGTKRNDITDRCRELIVKAYGEFQDGAVYGDKDGVYCQSKIFDTESFGYNKIVVERPQRDEQGEIVRKNKKPVPDAALRDTENVPLTEDIDAYFAREVLPYAPDAWIDKKKTKVGYEIPMTRYFYEYQPPEAVEDIWARIGVLEKEIAKELWEIGDYFADVLIERETARRIAKGDGKVYTEKEVMDELGITEEDLAAVGDVEIE
ncbi:MAG: hypothetical protein IJ741_07760, partial [Schwartzia sp.]|nr:hypothetical protein [Schwartzia sp. (in: firmicutes)]